MARQRREDRDLAASARRLADALRAGRQVPDAAFDAHFPDDVRAASWRHWTPVEVAVRAAGMLARAGATCVLDVGAGAGKFAVVAALAEGLAVVGVEQSEALVKVARRLAGRFGVDEQVDFLHGDLAALPESGFDGIYLFNPFGERLDANDDARYREEVVHIEGLLACAPPGLALVAYHGFGGTVPDGFALVEEREAGTGALQLWRKGR